MIPGPISVSVPGSSYVMRFSIVTAKPDSESVQFSVDLPGAIVYDIDAAMIGSIDMICI